MSFQKLFKSIPRFLILSILFHGIVMLTSLWLNELSSSKKQEFKKAQTISVVLTEKLPPSNLTVYELVALGRYPYVHWLGKLSALDKQKIDEAIQLTEIQDLITKNHEEISDGQLQKVLIARALAQDTPLIILDEPTTHLDFQNKINILQLLKKLTLEHQKTIIFSTHDLDFALQIADELLVLTPQTYLKNTPEKLLETPIFNTIFDIRQFFVNCHINCRVIYHYIFFFRRI